MAFCFVHAADLHLDSPLKGLARKDADVARQFGDATRRAFRALIDRTIEEGAAFLIIAGDIFDGDWRDYSTGLFFTREISRLNKKGIRTYIVRGNHDAENIFTKRLPDVPGVFTFGTRACETFDWPEIGVALHGRSFANRSETESLVRTYRDPLPGRFNIGVLHTSLDGREGHANYAPATVADLAARGYDYWALGHVHNFEIVARDPWIVFPGNLQGRSIRETGPKGAMLVHVDDQLRVAGMPERIILDEARWAHCEIAPGEAADIESLTLAAREAFAALVSDAGSRSIALRVTLSGECLLHEAMSRSRPDFVAAVEAAAAQTSDSIWVERVVIATRAPATRVTPSLGDIGDPESLIAEALDDPAFEDKLKASLQAILEKLPQGTFDYDREAVLAEARDYLLSSLHAGEAT